MDRRVEIVIEGRVSASVDQAAVEEAKRKAAEVEVAAREAGEALSNLPQEVAERVAEAAQALSGVASRLDEVVRRTGEALRAQPTPLEAAYARALGMDHPMYRRVLRGLEGVEAQAAGARTASDYARLEGRLATLDRYLEIALAQGADPKAADRLREEMARLREEIARQREARERVRLSGGGSGGGGGTPPGGSPPPEGEEGGEGGGLLGEVLEWGRGAWRRAAMGGLSRLGPLGAVLARLGPWGMAAGALVAIPGAISLGARLLEGLNREARNEVEGAADLARLLEYDRNPLALFRRPGTLLPDDRLLNLGYTTRDAQRYAALYGLPGGVQGDVRDILAFSRTTGIGEEAAVRAARELGLIGLERGRVGAGLEVLKAAMAEGVREGVDKASTLQGLLQVTRESAARGVSLTPTGLAFQASLQAALAGTGNRLLQGEMGARAQASLQEAFAGAGDPGLQMFLVNVLGGLPSARDLGLSGTEARGYERLRRADPGRAMEIALRLLPQRNPAMWARMVAQAEAQLGVGLTTELLRSVGIEGEALLTLLGTGVGQVAERAARRTGAMRQDLLEDPQGRNRLYWQGVRLDAQQRAAEEANQLATLAATKDLEAAFRNLSAAVERASASIKRAFGEDIAAPGGSLRGPAGRASAPASPEVAQALPGLNLPAVEDRAQRDIYLNAALRAMGAAGITAGPGQSYDERVRRQFPQLPERHQGLDVTYGDPRRPGDPVPSPFAGRVVRVGQDPKGYGNYVVLDVGGKEVIAGHFQEVRVRPGQEVRRGEVLGLEGSTGAATGPHVHWEIRQGGKAVTDREAFMDLFYRLMRESEEQQRRGPEGAAPERKEIVVRLEGLDRIRVEGVPGPQADLIRQGVGLIVQGTLPPPNWKGG
ncbi:M23 family metallopeptidase [Thermus sp. SYSU G05001]|uniref:M23 family metallopeptidase n=1 Tax=Thermus brevis TaxID=2862456 RepID=A0ABS7A152_9DEIN|nr:M23 family metallopeptidase [Thermus brevis]MBW6396018.1 M23 family metallopeptidase [Thermus brevis]